MDEVAHQRLMEGLAAAAPGEAESWPDGSSGLGSAGMGLAGVGMPGGARAAIVNRTHRVVRERAEQMRARRRSVRGLVAPLLICSALLLMMAYALWTVLAGGNGAVANASVEQLGLRAGKLLGAHGMDADGPLSVLFFWFLPVSAVALGAVLFGRLRGRGDDEVTR